MTATAVDAANGELWLTHAGTGLRELLTAPLADATLSASGSSLSAAAGGRIDFQLDAGAAWAGADYLLLAGAASGPGASFCSSF